MITANELSCQDCREKDIEWLLKSPENCLILQYLADDRYVILHENVVLGHTAGFPVVAVANDQDLILEDSAFCRTIINDRIEKELLRMQQEHETFGDAD